MATHFDDFSGYSTGAFGTVASANWTAATETGTWFRTVTAAASETSGQALVFNNNSSGDAEQLYYSPTPGSTTSSIEVLAYLKWAGGKSTSGASMGGAALITSTGTSYTVKLTAANTWQLTRWSATGSVAAALGTATDIGVAGTANTYHWIRIGRTGTNSLYASIWTGAIGDEPGSPQLTATDSSLTTLYGGIAVHESSEQNTTIDILSIGIGEAAPSSGAGGGGGVPKTTKLALLGVG